MDPVLKCWVGLILCQHCSMFWYSSGHHQPHNSNCVVKYDGMVIILGELLTGSHVQRCVSTNLILAEIFIALFGLFDPSLGPRREVASNSVYMWIVAAAQTMAGWWHDAEFGDRRQIAIARLGTWVRSNMCVDFVSSDRSSYSDNVLSNTIWRTSAGHIVLMKARPRVK